MATLVNNKEKRLAEDFSHKYQMEIVNPNNDSNWNNMLLNSPDYSIFHTSNWASVLSDSYGFKPYYCSIMENDRLGFLLPMMEVNTFPFGKKVVSLPFTDYCNPIMSARFQFSNLLPEILYVAKQNKWKSIQIRDKGISLDIDYPSSVYYRHFLSLENDQEKVFRKFRENYRSKIKKAVEWKIEVSISQTAESLEQYYKLHCITRQRQGLPPQPYYYFRNVFTHIITKNLGFIVLASVGRKIITGAVFFCFGEKAVYKYGASDMNYNHLFANYLMFWEAIQWLCENGYKELCFGRSEPLHRGLIQFKDGWGTERDEINYYKYDVQKKEFVQGNKITRIPGYSFLRVMPISMLKLLGSLIYRYGA